MKSICDVVIVGGGVIGASIAYQLSRDTNLSITLIDQKRPGNASRASAGGLWAIGESVGLGCGVIFFKTMSKRMELSNDSSLAEDIKPHQLPRFFFDFCLKSNNMFPALWQEIKDNHGLDFKLQKTGLKFVIYDKYDMDYAQQIYNSIGHLHDQVRWYDTQELREDEPYVSHEAIGALEFMRDDQVNPYLLVEYLLEAARRQGVNVISNTAVCNIKKTGDRISSVITSDGDEIACNTLINASGSWASEVSEMATGKKLPIMPVKGQIVLTEKTPKIMNACMSTSDCYIAQKDNGEILIGATTEEEGFDITNTIDTTLDLAKGAARCLPILNECSVKRCWSGLRPATPDEVPIMGRVEGTEGYINACGHFRTGIVTSALTADIISCVVQDKPTPIDITPFLTSRFTKDNYSWSFLGEQQVEPVTASEQKGKANNKERVASV